MKIAIIGDLHYGLKSNDCIVDKKLNYVFDHYIFPYILENNIKYIIQLGDVFETKKGVDSRPGYYYVKHFLKPIIENGMILYQILGNHDIFYDKSNQINTLKMFFELAGGDLVDRYEKLINESKQNALKLFFLLSGDNLHLIDKYEKIIIDKREICFLPYAYDIDLKEIYGDVLFGHLDIDGFEMQKGVLVQNGIRQSVFSNFEKVISGHIHRRDTQKNITYVGNLVEKDFGENDFIHGFHVLDMDDLSLEFIPVDEKIFIEINNENLEDIDNLENKVIKVELDVDKKIENEKYIEMLREKNPIDVKVKYIEKRMKNIEVESYDFLKVLGEYVKEDSGGLKDELLMKIIMKRYWEVCL